MRDGPTDFNYQVYDFLLPTRISLIIFIVVYMYEDAYIAKAQLDLA